MIEKYSFSAFWSNEDEGYIALVSEFPGLSAFGETRDEALKEAEAALQCMIELFQEEGKPLPEPRALPEHSGQLRLRMPKHLHTKLAFEAEHEGTSLNSYIVSLLAGSHRFKELERRLSDLEQRTTEKHQAYDQVLGSGYNCAWVEQPQKISKISFNTVGTKYVC